MSDSHKLEDGFVPPEPHEEQIPDGGLEHNNFEVHDAVDRRTEGAVANAATEHQKGEQLGTLRNVLLRFPAHRIAGREREQRTELQVLEHELELNLSAGTDEELAHDLAQEKKNMSGWWYQLKMSLMSRVNQGSMFYKLHPQAMRRGQGGIDNMEAILEERVELRKKISELKGENYEEVDVAA
jgi:hypothetical protein